MSRKDTIIIAVLINVGLLIVLFATAVSSISEPKLATSQVDPEKASTKAPIQAEVAYSSHSVRPVAVADEVDQVLTQYSLPTQTLETPIVTPSSEIAIPNVEPEASSKEEIVPAHVETRPALKSESAFVEVTVKKGDVLEKIARIHQCGIEEIMKANQLSSSRLRIGQVLRIPQKSAHKKETVIATSAKPSENTAGGKYYVVKPGDNPWTIAVKNHMKVEELLRLNNLDEKAARKLKPGDQLRIR